VYADRVLYAPERLDKIAIEAAREGSIFSLNDRIGLVHDVMALAQAGLAKVSSALNLVNIFRKEKECEYFVYGRTDGDSDARSF
jgi:aminopeptidase 2